MIYYIIIYIYIHIIIIINIIIYMHDIWHVYDFCGLTLLIFLSENSKSIGTDALVAKMEKEEMELIQRRPVGPVMATMVTRNAGEKWKNGWFSIWDIVGYQWLMMVNGDING